MIFHSAVQKKPILELNNFRFYDASLARPIQLEPSNSANNNNTDLLNLVDAKQIRR